MGKMYDSYPFLIVTMLLILGELVKKNFSSDLKLKPLFLQVQLECMLAASFHFYELPGVKFKKYKTVLKNFLKRTDFIFSSSTEISQLLIGNSVSEDCSFIKHSCKLDPLNTKHRIDFRMPMKITKILAQIPIRSMKSLYQVVRFCVKGMRVIAVHHSELINHRHVSELVYKIVVVVMASWILIYETTFFQL
ncbi:hypothetical protein AGLY_015560 [Aphis glycines]|uniref:Uncharacterized protein n=1 Tax=Aphis glycines TaxID=307491 RepID=A0A6G0SZW2_APHGL|nr:hypothetical protein AGLY_015560 [Aphis glycines]